MKLKRCVALLLLIVMAMTCMPMQVLAEEMSETGENVSVEVIPEAEEASGEDESAYDGTEVPETETGSPDDETAEGLISEEVPETNDFPTEPEDLLTDETQSEDVSAEQLPKANPAEETDSTETEPSDSVDETIAPPVDLRHPLQAAMDTYGSIYVTTVHQARVFSNSALTEDALVYTTTQDIFIMLATEFTDRNTVMVWFLDEDGETVHGYVSADDLNEQFLLEEDLDEINFLPQGDGMTDHGVKILFQVSGSYPDAGMEPAPEQSVEPEEDPNETPVDDGLPVEDMFFPEDTELPQTEAVEPEATDEPEMTPDEVFQDSEFASEKTDERQTEETVPPEELKPEETPGIFPTEDETLPEEVPDYPEEPVTDLAGKYVGVTTETRVFGGVDSQAVENDYTSEYLGNFVKNATVQILSVEQDEAAHTWYQVRFLYGNDFPDGRMIWTDYATAWILADETMEAFAESCSVTDFAFTDDYLNTTRSGARRILAATPMNGFSLKNIHGAVGGFYAFQSGLYGSSGLDSDYPQLAKSTAHGTIYATPHYLDGFVVYCLEHNLSGPGEGTGSDLTAKGPYVLVDMDTFVTDPSYGGASGVRYSARTMHALGWVLRHTYPFMALDRNDSDNEVWSRAAGQFAMREVIKQLEGAQYVRYYWDMNNFYAFSGGAPAVYLEYARWLAANGIARASITGNISVSDQRLTVSGGNYIGTVTVTTDADLIRISKSAGTITGNSGGSDENYYYLHSGDTIQITSSESRFSVMMESMASDAEEARFLIGVASAAIQKVLVPLYGAPYTLKSGSVTFELSYGDILITKQSADGVLLEGTVFELLNSEGVSVATATTAANGTARFTGLLPGVYTVREKTASQGYRLSAASQNISVVAGVTSTATFTNDRIMGRIRIVKTDKLTEQPLPGAVFTVTRLSAPETDHASDIGKVVATITTNEQGIAETDLLPWGEYKIEETGVPEGYLDAGYTTTVWIK